MNGLDPRELALWPRRRTPPPVGRVVAWLTAAGPALEHLYRTADAVRRAHVGDAVHLRGLVEFSNHCACNCAYCGIRGGNPATERYRMTPAEIVAQAGVVKAAGCPTVVLQSGEDPWFTRERVCAIVREIKAQYGLAVTLSIGERPAADYRAFRAAGCDRYLLRFETADRRLYNRLHLGGGFARRLACLAHLRRAGLQVGSGFLIGLPGANLATLARDLVFATRLKLDMIGVGPFIPHPNTPLAEASLVDDHEVYFRVIALLRLLNPRAHIPATTAFDAVFAHGRDQALQRGANVFMPNLTPKPYRDKYLLYPNKPGVDEVPEGVTRKVIARLRRLGRPLGVGPGDSLTRPPGRRPGGRRRAPA